MCAKATKMAEGGAAWLWPSIDIFANLVKARQRYGSPAGVGEIEKYIKERETAARVKL